MTAALQARLDAGNITLCRVFRITRADGVVRRFAERDAAVVAGGETYAGSLGVQSSAIELSEGLEPTTIDLEGFFDAAGITQDDLLADKYSLATVKIGLADFTDPAEPIIWLTEGVLGNARRKRLGFQGEVNGITRFLDVRNAEATSPMCRATLADARCKVNMTSFAYATAITSVIYPRLAFTVVTQKPENYALFGKAIFTSGASAGQTMEIARQEPGIAFALLMPLPTDFAVGDTVTIQPGCDGQLSTCATRFNNVLNFRGEPYLPGVDRMTENQRNFI